VEGKSILNSIAIFCLALSIVIGSWFISQGLRAEKTSALPTQEHLLTQQQIASYLGLSEQEVGKLISSPGHSIDGEIPHYQLGNKNYFDKKAVTQWFQSEQVAVLP
jgi:excisionase family DNA binding protein